jgi:hypothetical protein
MEMSEYNPDKWVMLKFNYRGEIIYKILASWYGGYARGDSWKLNSGVTKIEEEGQLYRFHGTSGSVYQCHKATYGMSAYSMGILANFQEQVKEMDNVTLELLTADTNFMELNYE